MLCYGMVYYVMSHQSSHLVDVHGQGGGRGDCIYIYIYIGIGLYMVGFGGYSMSGRVPMLASGSMLCPYMKPR